MSSHHVPADASPDEVVRDRLLKALTGEGSHARTATVLDELPSDLAGRTIDGFPHTICAIVGHLIYWREFAVRWLAGEDQTSPGSAAESWPGLAAPEDEAEWSALVERYRASHTEMLDRAARADLFELRGRTNALAMLWMVASHDSYHVGQIALMRQAFDVWPPPGGGETW